MHEPGRVWRSQTENYCGADVEIEANGTIRAARFYSDGGDLLVTTEGPRWRISSGSFEYSREVTEVRHAELRIGEYVFWRIARRSEWILEEFGTQRYTSSSVLEEMLRESGLVASFDEGGLLRAIESPGAWTLSISGIADLEWLCESGDRASMSLQWPNHRMDWCHRSGARETVVGGVQGDPSDSLGVYRGTLRRFTERIEGANGCVTLEVDRQGRICQVFAATGGLPAGLLLHRDSGPSAVFLRAPGRGHLKLAASGGSWWPFDNTFDLQFDSELKVAGLSWWDDGGVGARSSSWRRSVLDASRGGVDISIEEGSKRDYLCSSGMRLGIDIRGRICSMEIDDSSAQLEISDQGMVGAIELPLIRRRVRFCWDIVHDRFEMAVRDQSGRELFRYCEPHSVSRRP